MDSQWISLPPPINILKVFFFACPNEYLEVRLIPKFQGDLYAMGGGEDLDPT